MSASGNEDTMADQVEGNEAPEQDEQESLLFATIQYEEGTSGPLKMAAGILVEDAEGITILDPEDGVATSIGDRFIVRLDVQQVEVSDDDEDEDTKDQGDSGAMYDAENLKDQVDTSADRFRA